MKLLTWVVLLSTVWTGCTKNETDLLEDQLFTVSLKINGITQTLEPITKASATLPDTIRLRITMHVFDQSGTVVTKDEKLLTEAGGNIPVEFSVKKGIYDMAFWADYVIYKNGKITSQAYTVDNMRAISINSGSGSSDAYSLAIKGVSVSENTTISQNTTLNRAVSMLKIESDKEVPTEIKKARYTVSKSVTSLNVLTGETIVTNTPVSYEDDLLAGTLLNVGRYIFPCDPFTCTVEMLDEVNEVVATVVVENVETESNSQTKLEGDFFEPCASVSFTLNFAENWGAEKIYIVDKDPAADFINIPDPVFRGYCLNSFDANRDGNISKAEAAEVLEMSSVSDCLSLQGIEHFVNLQKLIIPMGVQSSPDLSKNRALKYLLTQNSNITTINLENNTALETLRFGMGCSKITTLDVSKNTALKKLEISTTQLVSIDVSNNLALEYLEFYRNPLLTSIDISNNLVLTTLLLMDNPLLTSIDISNNLVLPTRLFTDNPSLTTIYVFPDYPFSIPDGVQVVVKQ